AQSSLAPTCLLWPTTSLARATSGEPIPDVPALVLTGTRDLRTPLENANAVTALLPHGARVVVPNRGHSLMSAASWAQEAVPASLHDQAAGDPCAALTPIYDPEAPPPTKLGGVDSRGLPGLRGRIISAVIDTLNDALGTTLTVSIPAKPVQVGGLRAG